jgi:ethanolamine transporter
MNAISVVVLIFSVIGAADYLLGNKLGVGDEFKKGFSLFCPMVLSMLGMIVIAPALGVWLTPAFEAFYRVFGIDPSIVPASLFANDMGGMQLAQSLSKTEAIGNYNAFVISSMMGCVISFTIPFSIGIVKKEQHKDLFFGFLCGMITIPVGSLVAGLMCSIPLQQLLINLIPLLLLSVILGVALLVVPKACIKCFTVFGVCIKVLALVGLMLAIFTFLTKIQISPWFDTFENGAFICANACVTLSGALPFMHLVTKLLKKPLGRLSKKLGIDSASAAALLGTTVTNATAFGTMDKMNPKGVVLNAAFAVSGAFAFGSHLAFTMAFDGNYILPMIVGKLISGICAVVLACLIYKAPAKEEKS